MELDILRAVEHEHAALLSSKRPLDPIMEEEPTLSTDDSVLLRRRSLRSELETAEGVVVMQTHRFRRHYRSLLQCISRNLGKGFVLGLGANATISLLSWLLAVARGRKTGSLLRQLLGRDSMKYGIYFGSLLTTYNSVMYTTRFETGTLHYFRAAMAGALAGIASTPFAPPGLRRTLALFFFVRGVELQARMWARRGWLPSLQHADTLLMSVTSAEVMWAWLFRQESLDQGYLRFLNHHGQKALPVLFAIDQVYKGKPLDVVAINKVRSTAGVAPLAAAAALAHRHDPTLLCSVVHPCQSCSGHAARYFANGWRMALPVYLPVYAIPMVLFAPKRLLSAPLSSLKHLIIGVARSSLFLSAYTSIGFAYICAMRSILHPKVVGVRFAAPLLGWTGGAFCGAATLFEKRSRRIELALYVLTHALRSAWYVITTDRLLPRWLVDGLHKNDRGLTLMLSWGLSMVMHAFVRHPQMLRRSYFGLGVRLFDSEDHRHTLFGKSDYAQQANVPRDGATQTSPRMHALKLPPVTSRS